MAEGDSNFVSAFQESIMKRGTIDYTVAHGIIVGPGRSGKDSLMKCLLGEKLVSKSFSTGILESVVKVEVQKMCTVAAAVRNLNWQRLEYDEEALELMMTTAKYSISTPISSTEAIPLPSSHKQSSNVPTGNSSVTSDSEHNQSVAETEHKQTPDRSANDSDDATHRNVAICSSDIAPVDIFKKALRHRHNMDALRKHLESSWSLYLTNTGGQIEFQELLPVLVCGPSIFFYYFSTSF